LNTNLTKQIKNADKECVIHLDPNYLCEAFFDMEKLHHKQFLLQKETYYLSSNCIQHRKKVMVLFDVEWIWGQKGCQHCQRNCHLLFIKYDSIKVKI